MISNSILGFNYHLQKLTQKMEVDDKVTNDDVIVLAEYLCEVLNTFSIITAQVRENVFFPSLLFSSFAYPFPSFLFSHFPYPLSLPFLAYLFLDHFLFLFFFLPFLSFLLFSFHSIPLHSLSTLPFGFSFRSFPSLSHSLSFHSLFFPSLPFPPFLSLFSLCSHIPFLSFPYSSSSALLYLL